MSERRARPVLLYDGVCGFCTRSVEVAIALLDADVDYQPYQVADLGALGVSETEAAYSLQWVAGDGRIGQGSVAVARLLIDTGGPWSLLGRVLMAPPLSWVAELGYRLVSHVRHWLPGSTPAMHRPAAERPGARTSGQRGPGQRGPRRDREGSIDWDRSDPS